MSTKITGILLLLLIVASCNSQTSGEFWFLEKDKNYDRVKTAFQDYVSFFPKRGDAYSISDTWSLDSNTEFNIKSVFEFKSEQFKEALSTIRKSSIAEYPSDAECLLVLNRFATHSNYGYPKKHEIDHNIINLDCYKDLYPIPNFSNFSSYQTDETEPKLQKEFNIYVLEAKTGRFLAEEDITKGLYMPEEWKHGYSKGVAVNESKKLMIFWVIIW
ncbi:hypothetical protein KDU71_22600 [Carboxylicivirga sediminis]|uniref:Uncharacterized protein n=1 Tax=Carboxylicivirga sediminis TaxID=2006564 RepID=A0A941J176_9BACT|nr:hypothetical protein [Carboxylicivirga sediminis]MBR8538379.1 hypothetical protein [Carboxylicivirga sediminis]